MNMKFSSSSSPLVSIIIPAFNCQHHILTCIDSILSQTYSNIEILIADDCSTDKTRKIINSFDHPKIKKFFNEINLGVVTTRNNLISNASGELIAFQDADDWSHKDRIKNQIEVLSQHEHIGVCSTGFNRVNNSGKIIFTVSPNLNHTQVLQGITPKTHPALCYPSIMTYKIFIEKCNFFQHYFNNRNNGKKCQFIGGEDIDLLYRILEYTEIRNIPEPYYFYRASPLSLSNDISLDNYSPTLVGPRIAYLLRQQRLSRGHDLLQEGKTHELDKIKKDIQKEYNIHDIYSSLAPRMADLRLGTDFSQTTFRYIKECPLSLKTYFYIMISMVRYLLGHTKYKILRDKLYSSNSS